MERLCAPLPELFGIRDGVQVTLSAQAFTTPWIMLLFGRLSLIAPLSNPLILPFVPFAMMLGFGSITLSFLSFPLGQLAAYAAWGVLELMIRAVHTLASVPFASLAMPNVGTTLLAVYYTSIAAVLWFLQRKSTLTTDR
jgi:competence protein ComEC